MVMIRNYLIFHGRKDTYFNEFDFLLPHRGGNIEAGTSSVTHARDYVGRERWVDIEQRAQMYSPNPCAAAWRDERDAFVERENALRSNSTRML